MDVDTSTDAVGNGGSADAAVAGESTERSGPGRRASAGAVSICMLVVGLVVMSGFFLVRLASVVDEMSASANLVIPGESAVMSDGEFVRSLLPATGVAGIVHLVGVVAGLMGRTCAEGRRELARCALGVGANAFFLACACVTPVVGLVPDPLALVPLLVVCGAAVLAACVSLFRGMCASAGAISVGAGAAGMLAMAGAFLVGLFAMLYDLATTPGRPFLPALIVVVVCIHMSVPAGLVQLTGLIVGIWARRHADSEAERALAGRGIVLNVPLCWCVLFLPLLLASASP